MSVKGLGRATAAGGLIAVLATGVALASAPVLQTGKAYESFTKKGLGRGLSLSFVVSASNPKRLIAGSKGPPPLGTEFAESSFFVPCPKIKRNPPPFPKDEVPFAGFGFPGATLKLSHEKYRFSVSKTMKKEFVTGSPAKPFKLTLKVTGAVTSSTTITGTVSLRGGRCTSKRPIPYTAKLDNKIPVSPGD
jgi:hypothetical protein